MREWSAVSRGRTPGGLSLPSAWWAAQRPASRPGGDNDGGDLRRCHAGGDCGGGAPAAAAAAVAYALCAGATPGSVYASLAAFRMGWAPEEMRAKVGPPAARHAAHELAAVRDEAVRRYGPQPQAPAPAPAPPEALRRLLCPGGGEVTAALVEAAAAAAAYGEGARFAGTADALLAMPLADLHAFADWRLRYAGWRRAPAKGGGA